MVTIPYVYRKGITGTTTTDVGELPGKICNVNQAIWMTARRDTLSGATTTPIAPCLQCITTWKDQSVNTGVNNATLLNSIKASTPGTRGLPYYNSDYWTGDTTSNNKPFLSFDKKNIGSTNSPNFLAIPYDTSFSKLTKLTFSTLFRCRRINPNIVTQPDDGVGANVVLFQNGNSTNGSRTDGWGIDMGGSNELRVWYYDYTSTLSSCDPAVANSVLIPIVDWTDWMRLTVRISGGTMQANIYNLENYPGGGNTWINGCNNHTNPSRGIKYGNIWPANPDWFIGGQKGPGYPTITGDQTILNGAWDMLEYVLYDNWLPDSCVQTIWDYYTTQYNFAKTTGSASTFTQIGGTGATGTTTTAPVDLSYNYYWSGMILPQSTINKVGVITELQYYIDNSPTNNVLNNVKIYLGYTTTSAFSTATPSENLSALTTNWTLAYDGAVTFNTTPGWSSISLQNGFYYDNTKNLLIKFESRDGSQSSTGQPSFKFSAATNTMAYSGQSGSYPTGNGVRSSNRPIIKLGFL